MGDRREVHRVQIAILVGLACGLASWLATRIPGFPGQDFQVWWFGANALLEGRNPYTTIFYQSRPAFLYPLPAALITIPFAGLPLTTAGPVFIALSCGTLAFAVTRSAWWPLLMFASGSMIVVVYAAQFSALLTLGFYLSGAMWLGAVKPNVGLAMLAYRPSLKGAVMMVIVALISLISMPSWPVEWLAALRRSDFHYSPLLAPGGPLLLLALTKWRRPEARLLAAMAVLPSSPVVYEVLPLFVIPQTWKEMAVLAAATMVEFLVMLPLLLADQPAAFMDRGRWVLLWLVYIPALVIVLRRPNVR